MHPFTLKNNEGALFFSPNDIVRLQGSSNYTLIFFANKEKILTSKVLHVYETILASAGFIRIHKTHLVNAHCITKIDSLGNVYLSDDTIVSIARRRRKEVLLQLKQMRDHMTSAA